MIITINMLHKTTFYGKEEISPTIEVKIVKRPIFMKVNSRYSEETSRESSHRKRQVETVQEWSKGRRSTSYEITVVNSTSSSTPKGTSTQD